MSEKPKAEKSLRAKSPRQKLEDIKVLMSEERKAEKPLRTKSPRQKIEVLASEERKAESRRQKIFMSEDHRAGKSMSKEPKSKSRVKIHLPPRKSSKGGGGASQNIHTLDCGVDDFHPLARAKGGVALRKIQICTVEG